MKTYFLVIHPTYVAHYTKAILEFWHVDPCKAIVNILISCYLLLLLWSEGSHKIYIHNWECLRALEEHACRCRRSDAHSGPESIKLKSLTNHIHNRVDGLRISTSAFNLCCASNLSHDINAPTISWKIPGFGKQVDQAWIFKQTRPW